MHAFQLIVAPWSALIVSELLYGACSFSSLKRDIQGISANVLSLRLNELGGLGLVRKVQRRFPGCADAYEATEWALELRPILRSLNAWAWDFANHDRHVSAASLMLSLETFFCPDSAGGFEARIGFSFASRSFVATVVDRSIVIEASPVDRADVCFEATAAALAKGFFHRARFDPSVVLQGEVALAKRFSACFTR